MAKKGGGGWFRPGRNVHEASGSCFDGPRGGNGGRPCTRSKATRLPPASRARVNVNMPTMHLYADIEAQLSWLDAQLPLGWLLN
jgi:hypothetical protein